MNENNDMNIVSFLSCLFMSAPVLNIQNSYFSFPVTRSVPYMKTMVDCWTAPSSVT